MALDPDIAAQVAHLFDATLAQVLSGEVAGPPAAGPSVVDGVVVTDATIPGPGGPVPVRRYRCASRPADRPAPTLVWVHGGGWQYGSLDMPEADSVAKIVADALAGEVVSVGYRLAPEHHHPAALDDVAAVVRWAQTAGAAAGIDPDRLVVGGASAGATLAGAAVVALRDAGAPLPRGLVLAYPVIDPLGGPYPPEPHPACPPLLWLDRAAIVPMFETYLGRDASDARPPIVLGAVDPTGLPPTLVTTAEVDALAAQADRFAETARAAGVDVTQHRAEGVLHGYLNTVGGSRPADRALADHVEWVRGVIGDENPPPGVGSGPPNY